MLEFLSAWYNWVFLFPALVAVMMIGVELVFGGLSEMLGIAIDVDLDGVPDLDTGDIDFDVPDGHGVHLDFLSWLGMGKVPITILLEAMCLSFGMTGLIVNSLLVVVGSAVPVLLFPIVVLGSGTIAIFITKFFGGFLSNIVPSDSTMSKTPSEYIGQVATVVSAINSGVGQVGLNVRGIGQVTLPARKSPHLKEGLPRDTRVVIVGYDQESHIYVAEPAHLQGEKPFQK